MATQPTLTLDKPSYNLGDKVTLTVVRDIAEQVMTVTVKGSSGLSGTAAVPLIEGLQVSDSLNHVWTPGTDDGTTAVYTTTA